MKGWRQLQMGFMFPCAIFACSSACLADDIAAAAKIKAAFLYHFIEFVAWPTATPPHNDKLIRLCIIGDHQGIEAFKPIERLNANGRRLIVAPMAADSIVTNCDVLFIMAIQRTILNNILERISTYPILTVGDTPGFTEAGGMLGFVPFDGKIRFTANAAAANRAGLRINSRLLQLALDIK